MTAVSIGEERILEWLSHHRTQHPSSTIPLIVAISGPQGSGKTTLTTTLAGNLSSNNLSIASFSLDDFYLTHADQRSVALANPGNPLLKFRGNPGTHDLPLLIHVLETLKRNEPGIVKIPRYDKSLNNGLGDRLPEQEWTEVQLPVDVVLFEGWCVAFRPLLPPKTLEELIRIVPQTSALHRHLVPHLEVVAENIDKLHTSTRRFFDALIHLTPPTLEDVQKWVFNWRGEQEDVLRARVGENGAMTPEQVRDFVERFLPTYGIGMVELIGEEFREHTNRDWRDGCLLRIVIDERRNVKETVLV
ncbi:hypothetical protein HDU97_010136 [Phlyctochytrium planicorne]|nr:hypothetical protein HDU97_010136 [Phlyctochytrium planicorne]